MKNKQFKQIWLVEFIGGKDTVYDDRWFFDKVVAEYYGKPVKFIRAKDNK